MATSNEFGTGATYLPLDMRILVSPIEVRTGNTSLPLNLDPMAAINEFMAGKSPLGT